MSRVLEVFVSSPGDLEEERKVVAEVVGKLAAAAHVRPRYTLRALLYEELVPPVLAGGPQEAVNTFMMDPARCDVLVCLLGDRLGTPMKEPHKPWRCFRSGTEYELTAAYESDRRPRPQAMIYHRRPQRATADPAQRAAVDALVEGIRSGGGPFKGIAPAPFDDVADLRSKLTDHLDAVVTHVMGLHAVRRRNLWLAGLAAALFLLAGGYGAWKVGWWAGQRRGLATGQADNARLTRDKEGEPARLAQVQARTLLDVVVEGRVQKKVEELANLGCPVAPPLLDALGRIQGRGDLEGATSIVGALAGLATRESRERCGCPELLSVLKTENVAVRYCKATHELVLGALQNLSCRDKRQVMCGYCGKIGPGSSFKNVLCEGERPVALEDLGDLAQCARDRASCAGAGQLQ